MYRNAYFDMFFARLVGCKADPKLLWNRLALCIRDQASLGIRRSSEFETYAQSRLNIECIGLCSTLLALVVFRRRRSEIGMGLDSRLLLR